MKRERIARNVNFLSGALLSRAGNASQGVAGSLAPNQERRFISASNNRKRSWRAPSVIVARRKMAINGGYLGASIATMKANRHALTDIVSAGHLLGVRLVWKRAHSGAT